MKTRVFAFTLLLCSFLIATTEQVNAQSESHDFITYDTSFNLGYGPGGGYVWLARITRPANMFTANHPDTASRPAIIHQSGQGEVGMNFGLLRVYGPHYWMDHGWDGGVKLGNGTHYPVIISMQAGYMFPSTSEVLKVLTILLDKFHIKRNSVHVDGLSQGGFLWTALINHQTSAGDETGMKLIKSIVALQGVANGIASNAIPYDNGGWSQFARWATKYNGKFFGLEGTGDARGVAQPAYAMNAAAPNTAYFSMEDIGGGGHCCWNEMYDPFRYNWQNINPVAPNIQTNTYFPNVAGNYKIGSSIFQWMLRQGDTTMVGSSQAQAPAVPPTVNAGSNLTINLPIAVANLNGTASAANGSSITSTQWSKVNGPNATITSVGNLATLITGLSAGSYTFRLTANASNGTSASSDVNVTVNALLNQSPQVNAGNNQTISLPSSSVTLSGTASDPDGSISSYAWIQLSGPSSKIGNASAASTQVSEMASPGNYVYRLTVKDNSGASASSDVTVTVNAAPTQGQQFNGNNRVVAKVAPSEYKVGYLDNKGDFYTFTNAVMTKFDIGSRKVVDVCEGFNVLQMVDDQGYIWEGTGASNVPTRWETDATGAPFNNNVAVFGWWNNYVSIRRDGSLWFWGDDKYNMIPGTDKITRPIQISPAGLRFKKVVMGNRILGLTEDGEVWDWNGSTTPVKKSIPRAAIDIFVSSYNIQGCLIPDAGGPADMGYPYLYGSEFSFWGGNTGYNEPASMKALWKLTVPLKQIIANTNIIHWIDSQDRMWGLGDNPDGQLGNGTEIVNKWTYGTQYAWTWNKGEAYTGPNPTQIGAGISWKKLFKGNTISYYNYALDNNDSLYFWGRDKALNSGRGWLNLQEASVPNVMDVLTPTIVSPLYAIYQQYDWNVGNVNAGSDQNINGNSATLNGSATAPFLSARGVARNGKPTITWPITGYEWTKVSGPGGSISQANSAVTTITGLSTGTYVFRLVATDANTGTRKDEVTITVNAGNNQSPTAYAGPDISITLPNNSVTLNGSGSDPDGSVDSYSWTKLSGPSQGNIVSPSQPQTQINNLAQGTYKFELKVTDNKGATATSTITVTVNPNTSRPTNQAPTVGVCADQTITLPVNSTVIFGGGADVDGTIDAYQWTKLSGPAATFRQPSLPQTEVVGLVEGTYKFELKATDNMGATGASVVTVTVLAAPSSSNLAPIANAGNDLTITAPTNNAGLFGSGFDPDGTIIGYEWSQVSGPTQSKLIQPTKATTEVQNLAIGVYTFELKVQDNRGAFATSQMKVTVRSSSRANQAPVASAGNDVIITLPTNNVGLFGTASDVDGSIVSYEWYQISGPSQTTIISSKKAITEVQGLQEGTYEFGFSVKDNEGASAVATVKVIVNSSLPVNIAPQVKIGDDIYITLPNNNVGVTGTASDVDGTIVSYEWSQASGPSQTKIISPSSPTTEIQNLKEGIYVFQLKVKDNSGATAVDEVRVIVYAATRANKAPVADAGPDATVYIPDNNAVLVGSGTDDDGTVVKYQWAQLSGPSQATIIYPARAVTEIQSLSVEGVYKFALTVTDNDGGTNTNTVSIYVLKSASNNKAPIAYAGAEKTITLPVNTVTLVGSGVDPDGSIISYRWTKLSGPAQSFIVTPAQSQTVVNNLAQGVYTFELMVTDNNGTTGAATVRVIVNASLQPVNQIPTVNGGFDYTITLPVNNVTLRGSASDPDGNIISYEWTKISGPGQSSIISPNDPVTQVKDLVEGNYLFQLKVVDNGGASATAVVQVKVVQSGNKLPIVNAGADVNIILPANSIVLKGSASDPDGTIVSTTWKQISGPANATIAKEGSLETTFGNLQQGVYVFQLVAVDNKGGTESDKVEVEVIGLLSKVVLYPNPATSTLNIQINSSTQKNESTLWIVDAAGQIVYKTEFVRDRNTVTKTIDISKLKNGIYFVKVGADINTAKTLKFVKN